MTEACQPHFTLRLSRYTHYTTGWTHTRIHIHVNAHTQMHIIYMYIIQQQIYAQLHTWYSVMILEIQYLMLRHCAEQFQLFTDFLPDDTSSSSVCQSVTILQQFLLLSSSDLHSSRQKRRWPQGSLTWNNWRIVTDMCALPAHCTLCTVFTS